MNFYQKSKQKLKILLRLANILGLTCWLHLHIGIMKVRMLYMLKVEQQREELLQMLKGVSLSITIGVLLMFVLWLMVSLIGMDHTQFGQQ